jgi:hypothetical protein
MGFDDYKACVTLPDGGMLCFNERTGQIEIVHVTVKPTDLKSVSKEAIVNLKTKLDELGKQKSGN